MPALLDPTEWPPVDFRILPRRNHHVVQDRTVGRLGELLEERLVVAQRPLGLGDLDESLVAFPQHLGECQDVLVSHRIRDHRRAVEVGLNRVGPQTLDREPAETCIHALVQQPLHFLSLGISRRTGLGRLESHDVGHERGGGHVLNDVHALRRAVEAIQVLGDGFPVPPHADLHRLVGNCFSARHREHAAVAKVGLHRREAEAAVTEHDRSHTVVARDRAPRIPANLRIVVRVQIDEAGCHDHARGVDGFVRFAFVLAAEVNDAAVFDPDVSGETRLTGTVDDGPIGDVQVELGHGIPLLVFDASILVLQLPPRKAPRVNHQWAAQRRSRSRQRQDRHGDGRPRR